MRARDYWTVLIGLAALHLGFIWAAAALPAQDLPQHLAYARILNGLVDGDPIYRTLYEVVRPTQPYFAGHLLLAACGRMVSIANAAKLVYSAYAVALIYSFAALARTVRGVDKQSPYHPVDALGGAFVWNPIATMGFFEFTLAIPVFLMACRSVIQALRRPHERVTWLWVVITAAACTSLHAIAAAALMIFVVAMAGAHRKRTSIYVVVASLLSATTTIVLWAKVADAGIGSLAEVRWASAIRDSVGLDFIDAALRIKWSSPLTIATYLVWSILGPYRLPGLALVASIVAVSFAICIPIRLPGRTGNGHAELRGAIAFCAIAAFLPWGLYVPSEITFLNFRVIVLGVIVIAACVPVPALCAGASQAVLIGASLLIAGHAGYRLVAFGREVEPALRLMASVPRGTMMLSLCFGNTSRPYAAQFRLTHFVPMYHTAFGGGMNTQFWARYTEHLPVDYRPGKRPQAPADWRPWEFEARHLEDVDYILVEAPEGRKGGEAEQDALEHANILLARHAERLRCEERWCLYKSSRPSGPSSNGLIE